MQLLQELSIKNGPLCVGLDTDPSYIPQNILNKYENPALAVLDYNKAIIERVVNDKSACCFNNSYAEKMPPGPAPIIITSYCFMLSTSPKIVHCYYTLQKGKEKARNYN